MKKNYLVYIILLICVIIVITLLVRSLYNDDKMKNNSINDSNLVVEYDNTVEMYVVRDKITNQILTKSNYESEIKIYLDNPDYNPYFLSENRIETNSIVE